MLRIRNAYEDALKLLDATRYTSRATRLGNVHFFAGDWNIAKQFLDLGFTLSFTGVITFTHDYDEVVKNTPLDMILTETDSPYITPEPIRRQPRKVAFGNHGGTRNEPVNVRYIVQRIAEIKNLPVEQVQRAVVENAKRVFGV